LLPYLAQVFPFQIELSLQVGNVGLDVFVHHIVNATGGKEPLLTIQKLGRGLRRAPGWNWSNFRDRVADKKKVEYYDFLFTSNPFLNAHSLARIETLKNEGHTVTLENPFSHNETST
jgi:superfamily II DNA or RNA helicase